MQGSNVICDMICEFQIKITQKKDLNPNHKSLLKK